MKPTLVSSLVLFGSVAAVTACTHSVRRAALVPHQQAIGHSGAQAQSTEITVGTPNLGATAEPRLAQNENAGIVIPRIVGQGGLRVPWGDAMTIGFHAELGLDNGSTPLSDDQPDPEGDVMGGAMSLFYTARISPKFDLGIGSQLWVYSIPYAEYDTCVDCPGGSFTNVEHDRDLITVVSVGIIPTYEVAPGVSIFGGINARNHPTIEKSSIRIGPDLDIDEEVENGPLNAIGSVGADFMINDQFKVTGYLHRPIAGRPVIYGLTAGAMLTFVVPKKPVPTQLYTY